MSEAEWAVVRPLLPVPCRLRGRGGQPEAYCHRATLDAIRHLVDNGTKWRAMPADFPPWDRVYAFFRRWRNHDLVREFHDRLRRLVRERAGRDSEPDGGVIDSQSVKADAVVGSDSRGFDGGKLTNGRKRHVVVDTLGLQLAVMVTAADVGDRAAAQVLLTQVTAAHHLPALVRADGGRTHRQPRRVLPRCPRPDPRRRQTQPTREFPDPGRHPTGGSPLADIPRGSPLATGRSNTAGARTCATARQQCDCSAGGRPRGPEQHPFLCTAPKS
ncbi:IS5 family transposase [Streptomyces collinus]|uniref:IS5 family transposase n=1 Tax=Streptomyces collinus TaxID=42684 RepID=UPI00369C18A0